MKAFVNWAELLKIAGLAQHEVHQVVAGYLATKTENSLRKKNLGQNVLLANEFAAKLNRMRSAIVSPVVRDIIFPAGHAIQRIPIRTEIAADIEIEPGSRGAALATSLATFTPKSTHPGTFAGPSEICVTRL